MDKLWGESISISFGYIGLNVFYVLGCSGMGWMGWDGLRRRV